MLHSNDGKVYVKGTTADILSDLGCIVCSLTQTLLDDGHSSEWIKEQFAFIVSESFAYIMKKSYNKGGE